MDYVYIKILLIWTSTSLFVFLILDYIHKLIFNLPREVIDNLGRYLEGRR
jgi:hypothetical protein